MVALCGAALLGACSAQPVLNDVRGSLVIVGSAAQNGSIGAWRELWAEDNRNSVSVSFSPDGQEVGLQALKAGNTHVATAETPISPKDSSETTGFCGPEGAFSVPTAITPVGVAYNLGGIRGLKMDSATLSGIFSGSITTWDAPEIVSLNPGIDLPDLKITPVTAEDESAVTRTATGFLSSPSSGGWPSDAVDKWPGGTAGIQVPKYGEIPKAVDDEAGTIAFLNLVDIGNRFNTLALKFGANFATATTDPIDAAIAGSEVLVSEQGVAIKLVTPQSSGYQLGTVSYQTFCFGYPNAPIASLVKSWAELVTSDLGQARSKMRTGNYAPNNAALRKAQALVASIHETH